MPCAQILHKDSTSMPNKHYGCPSGHGVAHSSPLFRQRAAVSVQTPRGRGVSWSSSCVWMPNTTGFDTQQNTPSLLSTRTQRRPMHKAYQVRSTRTKGKAQSTQTQVHTRTGYGIHEMKPADHRACKTHKVHKSQTNTGKRTGNTCICVCLCVRVFACLCGRVLFREGVVCHFDEEFALGPCSTNDYFFNRLFFSQCPASCVLPRCVLPRWQLLLHLAAAWQADNTLPASQPPRLACFALRPSRPDRQTVKDTPIDPETPPADLTPQ